VQLAIERREESIDGSRVARVGILAELGDGRHCRFRTKFSHYSNLQRSTHPGQKI
jgi:hypothetical protein